VRLGVRDPSRDPGGVNSKLGRAADVCVKVVSHVKGFVGFDAEFLQYRVEDLAAGFANPEGFGDQQCVERCAESRFIQHAVQHGRVTEVGTQPESRATPEALQDLGVVLRNSDLLFDHAHVGVGQDLGELGFVDAESFHQCCHAFEGGELEATPFTRLSKLLIDLSERGDEVFESDVGSSSDDLVEFSRRAGKHSAIDLDPR
jgi:hypothetical protein